LFDVRSLPRGPRRAVVPPVLWRGVLDTPNGRRYPVWARVRITVERPVLRLAMPVRAGQPMEAAAELTRQPEYPLWPTALDDASSLHAMNARRSLPAGHVLTAGDLAPRPAVTRGEPIAVAIEAGNTRLQLVARAEANARVGDIVLVKNPLNGRRFAARVTGAGEASAAK
jgi:flagella basal body P-ring formation protein FlgA